MQVRVVTQQIARNHHQTDLCNFDTKAETPATALTLRVKKDLLFSEFKSIVAEKAGVPVAKQRHWSMAKRQNGTIRPDECLEKLGNETMGAVKDRLKLTVDLRIFVEESSVEGDEGPFFEPLTSEHDILLFVKGEAIRFSILLGVHFPQLLFLLSLVYDPRRGLLQYEGTYTVKSHERPVDLAAKINTRAGRAAGHPLKVI